MSTPLNASATTAGSLLSGSVFKVPQFQREYAWSAEEVGEFWSDLSRSLLLETYFLGLIILTDEEGRKSVVDGQQRLITLTLLASAIFHEANDSGRKALADRIQADFLKSIDYETDEIEPRLSLADQADNLALKAILDSGDLSVLRDKFKDEGLDSDILSSYEQLRNSLRDDIHDDPFKQLGAWADFITNKLYFAVFVHPDPASAYRVFEVINTRGVELTTADLLKNYILSQLPSSRQEDVYKNWRSLASQIEAVGGQSFVQYIRHVVTSYRGYILPKDLFDFLARRQDFGAKHPLRTAELINVLNNNLDLYLQMMDPRLEGPAEPEALRIFSALNDLSVIAVRPMLLSISETPDALDGMRYVLRLVVRRIVVGNLGTGNVERRLGETAKLIREQKNWKVALTELADLNPPHEQFVDRLKTRSFNKRVLSFLRHSIIQKSITPESFGVLHTILPRKAEMGGWPDFDDAEVAYLAGTLGNTFLTTESRRDAEASTWHSFRGAMLERGIDGELKEQLSIYDKWGAQELMEVADNLAEAAGRVWY